MGNSRTKNSALTMAMSSMRQLLTILLTFVSRTAFIYTLGAEYLGLNGLFSNILSILALSELGIGGAIAFYLYKPLADKDIDRIKVLMKFYRRCYNYVGLISSLPTSRLWCRLIRSYIRLKNTILHSRL